MTRNLLILTPEFNNSHQKTLSYAIKEAKNMKTALEPLGYNCTTVDSEITFDDLQTLLYCKLKDSSSNDYLVLYISSHGSHSTSTTFTTHQTEDTEIEMFMKNGIFNASELQSGLNKKFGKVSQVNCGNLCIIYDVCQAGIENIINTPKVPCSFLRIAACSYSQSSKETVFTERFQKYVSNHGTDWGDDYVEEKKLQNLFETKLNQTPELLSMHTSSRNFNLMKEFFESKESKTKPVKTKEENTKPDKEKTQQDTWNYLLLALAISVLFVMFRNK